MTPKGAPKGLGLVAGGQGRVSRRPGGERGSFNGANQRFCNILKMLAFLSSIMFDDGQNATVTGPVREDLSEALGFVQDANRLVSDIDVFNLKSQFDAYSTGFNAFLDSASASARSGNASGASRAELLHEVDSHFNRLEGVVNASFATLHARQSRASADVSSIFPAILSEVGDAGPFEPYTAWPAQRSKMAPSGEYPALIQSSFVAMNATLTEQHDALLSAIRDAKSNVQSAIVTGVNPDGSPVSSSLTDHLMNISALHNATFANISAQLSVFNASVSGVQAQLRLVEASLEGAASGLDRVDVAFNSSQQRTSLLERRLNATELQLGELRMANQTCHRDLTQLQVNLDNATDALAQSQSEGAQLRNELGDAQTNVSVCLTDKRALTEQHADLQSRYNASQSEQQRCEAELSVSQDNLQLSEARERELGLELARCNDTLRVESGALQGYINELNQSYAELASERRDHNLTREQLAAEQQSHEATRVNLSISEGRGIEQNAEIDRLTANLTRCEANLGVELRALNNTIGELGDARQALLEEQQRTTTQELTCQYRRSRESRKPPKSKG